jgi:hypothetical protein
MKVGDTIKYDISDFITRYVKNKDEFVHPYIATIQITKKPRTYSYTIHNKTYAYTTFYAVVKLKHVIFHESCYSVMRSRNVGEHLYEIVLSYDENKLHEVLQ